MNKRKAEEIALCIRAIQENIEMNVGTENLEAYLKKLVNRNSIPEDNKAKEDTANKIIDEIDNIYSEYYSESDDADDFQSDINSYIRKEILCLSDYTAPIKVTQTELDKDKQETLDTLNFKQ